MGFIKALRAKLDPSSTFTAEDRANIAAMEERERGNKIRAKTAKAAADKKKTELTWSGKDYASKVKKTVGEMD